MIKYEYYTITVDFLKSQNRPHLFYLLGKVKDKNIEHVVASYSAKTKKLIIHNADLFNFQCSVAGLSTLVDTAEKCYKENIDNDSKN